MILDKLQQFSAAQALTTTVVGTSVIDLTTARAMGNGEPLCVEFFVTVAADQTTGDEDYTFDVEVATDTAQTTGVQTLGRRVFESGTPTTPAQDADLLVAGFRFVIVLPMATIAESARYLGVRYTLVGTTPTITVSAYLQPLSMASVGQVIYPKGYLN